MGKIWRPPRGVSDRHAAVTWNPCLGIALLLALLAAAGCRPEAPSSITHTLLQDTAPDFSRLTLTGDNLDTARLRGGLLVVKFFAQWCDPCQRTLPAFENLHRQRTSDVVFVGVSEDERAVDAEAQVKRYGLTFPIVVDRQGTIAARFRLSMMPMTFVIDRWGRLRWVGGPKQTETELAAAIAAFR